MKIRNEISIAEVRERFNYDPETGRLTRRTAPHKHPQRVGEAVGSIGKSGYLRVRVDLAFFMVHRLIWAHQYGCWPKEIDHIDRDKTNNRLENLRECTHSENLSNRGKFKTRRDKGYTRPLRAPRPVDAGVAPSRDQTSSGLSFSRIISRSSFAYPSGIGELLAYP
jgi:hypothetical protein